MARAKKPTMAEWTIMVFLNAKNNLEPFSFKNWDQMAKIGSTEKVNVLVEFGRPQRHYTSKYGGWSKTLRFRVEKGMKPTEDAAIEDLGAVNMGDGAALADFVTWSRTNHPAKRTMLAIWDHGQGWRKKQVLNMRLDSRELKRMVRIRESARARLGGGLGSLEPIPDDTRLHGAVRYVSHDEDTGDKLYNREIQDTLAGLVKDATIDVIGFDACLMSMLETAYALRDSGSVMVSSEELEPGDGWKWRPTGSTTAIPNLDTHMPAITRARNACENYAPGYGLNSIDLGRFLDQVTKAPGVDNTLAKKASTAKAALEDLVIANYASTSRQGAFGSEGLAIYFPKSQLEFNNDADHDAYQPGNTHYPVEFVDKQKWSNFMHSYLAQAG